MRWPALASRVEMLTLVGLFGERNNPNKVAHSNRI